ncbi:MAG: hypothetical protein Q9211_000897, partial [Gyalolechia sp. 1 TL-2023]
MSNNHPHSHRRHGGPPGPHHHGRTPDGRLPLFDHEAAIARMRADKDTIEFHRDASLYDSEDDGSDLFASDPSRAHRTRSPAPHHHDRRHGFEPHQTGARDRGRARMPWSDDDASGRHRQPRNSSLDRWEDYFEDDDEDEEPWIYDSDP